MRRISYATIYYICCRWSTMRRSFTLFTFAQDDYALPTALHPRPPPSTAHSSHTHGPPRPPPPPPTVSFPLAGITFNTRIYVGAVLLVGVLSVSPYECHSEQLEESPTRWSVDNVLYLVGSEEVFCFVSLCSRSQYGPSIYGHHHTSCPPPLAGIIFNTRICVGHSSFRVPAFGCWLSGVGFLMLAFGCWPSGVGLRVLAFG